MCGIVFNRWSMYRSLWRNNYNEIASIGRLIDWEDKNQELKIVTLSYIRGMWENKNSVDCTISGQYS